MIYQRFNFSDSFSNASGNRRNAMVISRLAYLIGTQPELIKDVLKSSNIKIPRNITNKGLSRIISKNRKNDLMIENISTLLVIESKVSNDFTFSNVDGAEKGKLFKKIGDWFKGGKERRQARKLARQGKEGGFGNKLGGIIKDNKSEVVDVGGSLLSGLFSRGGRSQLQAQTGQTASGKPINPYAKPPMSLGTKIGIGVGALVVLGVGIYFLRKQK